MASSVPLRYDILDFFFLFGDFDLCNMLKDILIDYAGLGITATEVEKVSNCTYDMNCGLD